MDRDKDSFVWLENTDQYSKGVAEGNSEQRRQLAVFSLQILCYSLVSWVLSFVYPGTVCQK